MPWLCATMGLPEASNRSTAWRNSSAAAGLMPISGRRISTALMRSSSSAWSKVSTMFSTDSPPPPRAAKGLVGAWSVRPWRRSISSTERVGTPVSLEAEAATETIRRIGRTTKKSISPAKTPAMVRKNCFMDPGQAKK